MVNETLDSKNRRLSQSSMCSLQRKTEVPERYSHWS